MDAIFPSGRRSWADFYMDASKSDNGQLLSAVDVVVVVVAAAAAIVVEDNGGGVRLPFECSCLLV